MPSAQTWRIPVWVPMLAIVISIAVLFGCLTHLWKRSKAKWPW